MKNSTKALAFIREHEKESRLSHSLNVAEVALRLSRRFNLDAEDALTSAYFHDAYRYEGKNEYIKLLEDNGIQLHPEEKENTMLLHGPIAALFIERDIGKTSEQVKRAIRNHTLASSDMGKLGAVLFVSDYIEKNRKHISDDEKKEIEKKPTLEEMVIKILSDKKKYYNENNIKLAGVTNDLMTYLESGGKFVD